MRLTVGMIGLLGLGFTVAAASAQTPGAPRRGAVLLPPVAVHPSELPAVVRAAPEDLPENPGMTPVTHAARTSPGWLNGTDPNVQPAGGTAPNTSPKNEPSFVSRSFDKLKNAFGPGERNDLQQKAPSPGKLPPGVATAGQPNANTPFRGTAANGAPVYAGPPAYRWYGWGSVTPGANPYAPTGQYPPASATWFSITGATPGAFPVPVMNPLRPAPGTEPPAYVSVPNRRVMPVTYPTSAPVVPTSRGAMPPSEPVAHVPPPTDLSSAATSVTPPVQVRPTPTPTITAPPTIAVPTLTPPPVAVATPAATATEKEPPLAAQQAIPIVPETKPIEPAAVVTPPVPAALPVSVTEDTLNWQPRTGPASGGEWGPAGSKPLPPATTPQQPGASRNVSGQSIARGQIADARPDATISLIRQLCGGRATGVDVRWTGSDKLTVSYTCRTAAEARQLAKDISARPELAPLHIDFSVSVK